MILWREINAFQEISYCASFHAAFPVVLSQIKIYPGQALVNDFFDVPPLTGPAVLFEKIVVQVSSGCGISDGIPPGEAAS
jgi:hypothetical protein